MNTSEELVHGILKSDGTLELERKLALPPGPVEVVIRRRSTNEEATEKWWQFLERSRAELAAQGFVFRTREEIDADRSRLRDIDETRRLSIRESQSGRE